MKRTEYNKEYYTKNREKRKSASLKYKQALDNRDRFARTSIYTHRAKGFDVRIKPPELFAKALKTPNCEICGQELVYYKGGRKGPNQNSASLDRMNNGKIITSDNVLILCWQCNVTKGNRTMVEFYEYCKFIAGKDLSRWFEKT